MGLTNHLVIFVKTPRLGRVKTRLAAGVGTVAAWTFYRRVLLYQVKRLTGDRRWRCWLAVTPDGDVDAAPWPGAASRLAQGTGDLGHRMARIMRALPPGPAVIIGTDIPDITPSHVARAFRFLGRHDAVFGPATDGGYWLVGLKRRPRLPDIFAGVRWSTEFTLSDSLAKLGHGHSVALLEILEDIDDGLSLERWRQKRSARH
ncbi:MAG: hypothetical protein CMM74_10465 [Rhodospirillaceae bacterium]|jgi:hypothetical protein|nr:hypothetical protein [Rhodospirillaceae bacterium]